MTALSGPYAIYLFAREYKENENYRFKLTCID